jgi:protein TonB
MRQILFIIIVLLYSLFVKAQTTTTVKGDKADTLIFSTVEHEPEFPGGMKKFWKYVGKNLHYPNTGIDVRGKVVIQFIVEKDGSVTHAKVIKALKKNLIKKLYG